MFYAIDGETVCLRYNALQEKLKCEFSEVAASGLRYCNPKQSLPPPSL
jgi:hypothetical protein